MEPLRSRVDRLLLDLGLARQPTVTRDANAIAAAVGVDSACVLLVVQSAERALYGALKGDSPTPSAEQSQSLLKRRRKEPVEAAEPAVAEVTKVPAAVEHAAQLLAALPSHGGEHREGRKRAERSRISEQRPPDKKPAEPAVAEVTKVPAAVEQAAQLLAALPSHRGEHSEGRKRAKRSRISEERPPDKNPAEPAVAEVIKVPAAVEQPAQLLAASATSNQSILGVRIGATEEELKFAYILKAAKLHPDTPTGNSKEFLKFLAAYRALLDDLKRQNPDACAQPDKEWIISPGLLLLLLREASPEEWSGLLASASYECLLDALDFAADQESLKTVLSQAQDMFG
eukprot:Skav217293  [mRNA]  locus=scaffold1466:120121:121437:+ [translate_table: standard]